MTANMNDIPYPNLRHGAVQLGQSGVATSSTPNPRGRQFEEVFSGLTRIEAELHDPSSVGENIDDVSHQDASDVAEEDGDNREEINEVAVDHGIIEVASKPQSSKNVEAVMLPVAHSTDPVLAGVVEMSAPPDKLPQEGATLTGERMQDQTTSRSGELVVGPSSEPAENFAVEQGLGEEILPRIESAVSVSGAKVGPTPKGASFRLDGNGLGAEQFIQNNSALDAEETGPGGLHGRDLAELQNSKAGALTPVVMHDPNRAIAGGAQEITRVSAKSASHLEPEIEFSPTRDVNEMPADANSPSPSQQTASLELEPVFALANDVRYSEAVRAEFAPPSSSAQASQVGINTTQAVAYQLVRVIQTAPGGPVELALNPEELGRVKLTFAAQDGTLVVTIVGERADTIDLMRRNIDTLAQEFKNIGFSSVNFSFSQDQQGREGRDSASDQDQLSQRELHFGASEQLDEINSNILNGRIGLDIRV